MLPRRSGSPQDRGMCYGGGSARRAEDPTNPCVGEDGRSPAQGGSRHAARGHGDGQQHNGRTCRPSCSKATAARSSCVPLGGAKSLLLYSTPPLLPAFYLHCPYFCGLNVYISSAERFQCSHVCCKQNRTAAGSLAIFLFSLKPPRSIFIWFCRKIKGGFKKRAPKPNAPQWACGRVGGKNKGGKEGAQLLPVVKMLKSIPEEPGWVRWVSLVSYLWASEINLHVCPAFGRKHMLNRWNSVIFPSNTTEDSYWRCCQMPQKLNGFQKNRICCCSDSTFQQNNRLR